MKLIKHRRCDEPMKRSKDNAYRHNWHCTGQCKTCICCIVMDSEGNEEHINPLSKAFKRIEENERLSTTEE